MSILGKNKEARPPKKSFDLEIIKQNMSQFEMIFLLFNTVAFIDEIQK